jgi:hypothetical protein
MGGLSDRVVNLVISLVCLVWGVNFFARFIPSLNYTPSESINAIFMAIVGGLIALKRNGNGGNSNDGSGSPASPDTTNTPTGGGS